MKVTPTSAGYSGKSLAGKLGIKTGTRIVAIGAPAEYANWLGLLPDGVVFNEQADGSADLVHLFVTARAELERQLSELRAALRADAAVWVSWPKKSSKVPTDITEDTIRLVALPTGWVDIKVCAVTDIWSGLKLVVRKELR